MTIAQINEVSVTEFGVNLVELPSTAGLWLANHILETTGQNVYLKISKHRYRFGRDTAFPAYGSELFKGLR
jgi:hypothetical protein